MPFEINDPNKNCNLLTCKICGRTKTRKHILFTENSLKNHLRSHQERNDTNWHGEDDPILELVDLIADGESDGVYWGIAYELGYFGD